MLEKQQNRESKILGYSKSVIKMIVDSKLDKKEKRKRIMNWQKLEGSRNWRAHKG